MIQEEKITNLPTDEIIESVGKKTRESIKKHINEIMTKSVACFAYGRPHSLPCSYPSSTKGEKGDVTLIREVNMLSNTRLYAQHQHVYHCIEEGLQYNIQISYSYIRDSHPQIWKDDEELHKIVKSCLDYLDIDREFIHIVDIEFPMLCGEVTVKGDNCGITKENDSYLVYPLPSSEEYEVEDFELPENLDCVLIVQSSAFLYTLKETRYFNECKEKGKPVLALSFANALDENTQKFISLVSKACEKANVPMKLLTDGSCVAIHRFVLPLKHGFVIENNERTKPICPSIKWIGLQEEDIKKKISMMYRIPIPDSMHNSYNNVINECKSLGENKLGDELKNMLKINYAMTLVQILAMAPSDFYIQWDDSFSKKEGI